MKSDEFLKSVHGDPAHLDRITTPPDGTFQDCSSVHCRAISSGELRAISSGELVRSNSPGCDTRESEWISTTKDPAIAVEKYGKNGVVRIDLSKVGSHAEDVSGGFPNGGRMSNWARADQKVLIQNYVPAEAIAPFNFSLIP